MYRLLTNFRVIEASSFVAAPSCGLHLQQMGAEVLRVDDMRRSFDRGRWPLSPSGDSLYWEGLNKGKKSVLLDLTQKAGREILTELITAPGDGAGMFLTNYPVDGFLSHARLAAIRPDLITLRVMGWADGRAAVDYTVNSAVGVPLMTGPASLGDAPVNHVLPAWDLLAGSYGAFALLAAERSRRETGLGQEIRVPLGDVAMAALGNLGQIAEVVVSGDDRARHGNALFGAFGRDFSAKDGRRFMVVAITKRQWDALLDGLAIREAVESLESRLGVSFAEDEGLRFTHRDPLFALVAGAIGERSADQAIADFERTGVCWGPYDTLAESVAGGEISRSRGLFETIRHPSGLAYPTPGASATLSGMERLSPASAPGFGQHTEAVLAEVLGFSSGRIARLIDDGIIPRPIVAPAG